MASLLALRGLIGLLLAYVGCSLIWPNGLLMVDLNEDHSLRSVFGPGCVAMGGGDGDIQVIVVVVGRKALPPNRKRPHSFI